MCSPLRIAARELPKASALSRKPQTTGRVEAANSAGVPSKHIRPRSRSATRSLATSASTTSWVTISAVKLNWRWYLRNHGKHGVAAQRIKARGWFVKKHEFWAGNDRASQRQTLLHAARKLAGVAIAMISNFKLSQSFQAAFTNLIVCEVRRLFKREGHILQGGQRIEEGIALKEETATPTKLRACSTVAESKRTPFEADFPCIRLHDVCQALKEHRLAGTAGAEHRENAAAQHFESDSCQNNMVVKALVQVFDMKQ